MFYRNALKMLDIKYKKSIEDNDLLISKRAIQTNGYIIARDTDYLIYGVRGYIPANTIQYSNYNTIGRIITQKDISSALNIEIKELPLLSSLLGNDWIEKNNILSEVNKEENTVYNNIIYNTCNWIINHRNNWQTVLDPEKVTNILYSINKYKTDNIISTYSIKKDQVEFISSSIIEKCEENILPMSILKLSSSKININYVSFVETDMKLTKYINFLRKKYFSIIVNSEITDIKFLNINNESKIEYDKIKYNPNIKSLTYLENNIEYRMELFWILFKLTKKFY